MIADLGSGGCPLASKMKAMQNPDVVMHYVRESGTCIYSCGSMGPSRRILLSSWAGCYPLPKYPLLHPTISFSWPYNRALPPRVISPR